MADVTLTEFLLARIADDENAVDRGPCAGQVGAWAAIDVRARVLAEVEAKRRIVERHSGCDDVSYGDASTCPDMRDLASVYADHPDYDQAWAV